MYVLSLIIVVPPFLLRINHAKVVLVYFKSKKIKARDPPSILEKRLSRPEIPGILDQMLCQKLLY